jgi:amino-acid N-acetyltransferase
MNATIRKAAISDVRTIYGLLNENAQKGLLLSRSLSDLYDQIRDFFVVVAGDDGKTVVGMCGLHICWEDIAEIRSLAVKDQYRGKNYGRMLVRACITESVELGLKRLFVLTYVPSFFCRFGFAVVEKSVLPHKVWADCVKCVKFPDCDETALMRDV